MSKHAEPPLHELSRQPEADSRADVDPHQEPQGEDDGKADIDLAGSSVLEDAEDPDRQEQGRERRSNRLPDRQAHEQDQRRHDDDAAADAEDAGQDATSESDESAHHHLHRSALHAMSTGPW